MPSKKSVIAYRPESTVRSELEVLANQLGKPLSEIVDIAVKEYLGRSNTLDNRCNTLQPLPDKDSSLGVTPSVCVCVGDKLDDSILLDTYIKDWVNDIEVLVFLTRRIVGMLDKSANGAKKYIKVVRVYSDVVWEIANLRVKSSKVIDKLEQISRLVEYPEFVAAIAKGLKPEYGYNDTDVLTEATVYLASLPSLEVSPQMGGINSQELPTTIRLTRDEFASRYHLDVATQAYSLVVQEATKGTYQADDGYLWSVQGSKKYSIWSGTMQPSLTLYESEVAVG